jgi:hypothetical protein
LAEEPAKKPEKPDIAPKIDLRIEVQTDAGLPHVFHLGNDEKNSQELSKLLTQFSKRMEVKAAQRENEKKPQPDAVMRQLTDQLANRAVRVLQTQHRQHHKGTYLGVATSEPPTVLRKQLGLHEGMGLVVDAVVPDSPAAKAGLKEYDVVQKIDDQLIVNYEQFTVLVRDHKPGDDVKLGVIHEGKPVVLTAKLIEHDVEVGDAGQDFEFALPYRAVLSPPGAVYRTWTFPAHAGTPLEVKLWDETAGKPIPDTFKIHGKIVLPPGAPPASQPVPNPKPK